MRRQFFLSEEDTEYLDSLSLGWETIRDGGGHWLFLHTFPLPVGYNLPAASVAINIPSGFPTAGLDMAYFYPALSRLDRIPLKQTQVIQIIDQKQWQRWSRHYTWRPGVDSLPTHVTHIRNWLEHGLGRNL